MKRNNAKSNDSGRGGSFGGAEFFTYRADANNSRADKEKYSKIGAVLGGGFLGEGKV